MRFRNALIVPVLLAACTASRTPIDRSTAVQLPANDSLVITGGTVLAGNELTPAEASILVRDGKIAGLLPPGASLPAGVRVIDARGLTILPGLTDAHAHIDSLGRSLQIVNLRGTRSFDEIVQRVAAAATKLPPGTWVQGRGWDQNDWPDRQLPTAAAIDAVIADHPVWLDRVDGHASVGNSAALRAARVTAATPDPEGGRIVRDAAGNPTGVFVDNARDLVQKVIPPPSRDVFKSRIEQAVRFIAQNGLTEVHQAGTDDNDLLISVFRELAQEGKLPIRVYIMLGDGPSLDAWLARGPVVDPDGRVTIRSVKLYADGALGSRGAALLAPYSDDPSNSGLLVSTPEHLLDVTRRARERGFQVNTHAIGDRGVRIVLDTYEKAGATPADRFRVEHLQVISPQDLPRLSRLGVIASMQPTHATSDMDWAERRLGPERIKGAYAWRSVLDSGARLAFGSDFPVEDVNPFFGIYAAVTRQDQSGKPDGGWYPEQRLTAAEAIREFSKDAAWAAFEENSRGTIEPGKLADLTIVEGNPLTMPPLELYKVKVRYTIVGGRVEYSAP